MASPLFSGCLTGLLAFTSDPLDGWIGNWSPGIGDPTIVGWVTVVAYLTASYACLRVFRRERGPASRGGVGRYTMPLMAVFLALAGSKRRLSAFPLATRLSALWLSVAWLLLFLGINKQLDLQTALTEVGRSMAHTEGWYERRSLVQVGFIIAVVLVGAWGLFAILLLARGGMRTVRGALLGTIFLVCFVAIRASSFHHVDSLLGYDFGGFKMNWLLELGGISFVGLSAYLNERRMRAARPRSEYKAR